MTIYGTALLALCLVCGSMIGTFLGLALGINANVGGVGIAMLLLNLLCGRLQATGRMPAPTQSGILFWSSIYIPIVVAMAASQDVRAAITGGPAAILSGTLAVAISFAMVPLISRLGQSDPVDSFPDALRSAPKRDDK